MSGQSTPPVTDITVESTEHLKGIALLLLMWHHLFGVGFLEDWLSPFKDIEYVTGSSAKICLAIFLFCSGYGLYRSYINRNSKDRLYVPKKIIGALVPYWIIMLIAIAVLAFLGKFDLVYIPANILAWIHDDNILYVSFSWYIKLYVLLLLVLPAVKLIEKKWKKNLFLDGLFYIVIPFLIYYVCRSYLDEEHFTSLPASILSSVLFVVFWFPLFAAGMIFAKYNIYTRIRDFMKRFLGWVVITLSLLVLGSIFFLRYNFYYYCIADVIYAPVFISACLLIMDNLKFRSRYVLPYLGKKSVYYWLLSGMFFLNTAELLPLITWPQIPVFILLWTLVLLTPFVFATDWVSGRILKLIIRK